MQLRFVKNDSEYWEFIRNLRNDERVKSGFIQHGHIEPESHINYMMSHGDNFFICLVNNTPAGFARVLDDDIGVCTHPDFQKKGVGKFMITELMKIHPNAAAKIKLTNEASIKLFESCGFEKRFYLLERKQ